MPAETRPGLLFSHCACALCTGACRVTGLELKFKLSGYLLCAVNGAAIGSLRCSLAELKSVCGWFWLWGLPDLSFRALDAQDQHRIQASLLGECDPEHSNELPVADESFAAHLGVLVSLRIDFYPGARWAATKKTIQQPWMSTPETDTDADLIGRNYQPPGRSCDYLTCTAVERELRRVLHVTEKTCEDASEPSRPSIFVERAPPREAGNLAGKREEETVIAVILLGFAGHDQVSSLGWDIAPGVTAYTMDLQLNKKNFAVKIGADYSMDGYAR
ncbi:hypothetical protein DFH11DRAFT_1541727 [Phellopilus nigrolimitatus]|nr:hypothetical protein DFH11DRAFT_1541727 [Phellopilus nigrolimitatus]